MVYSVSSPHTQYTELWSVTDHLSQSHQSQQHEQLHLRQSPRSAAVGDAPEVAQLHSRQLAGQQDGVEDIGADHVLPWLGTSSVYLVVDRVELRGLNTGGRGGMSFRCRGPNIARTLGGHWSG